MFYGKLKDLPLERNLYPAPLLPALDFLADSDFSEAKPGRMEIDGDRLFAIFAEEKTAPAEENQWEVHRRYADIQYLIEGDETIGFARECEGIEIEADALDEEDCLYYRNVRPLADLRLSPGDFAVFFPHDIHRPLCAGRETGPVRKVIVKIALELFEEAHPEVE